MSARAWFTRSVAALGALAVLVSCQAIVSSDVPAFSCDGTAGSCPAGKFCKGVGCADCESRDVCDGYDNDCNGKIDDGPDSDSDGDGYTVCGSRASNGGFVNVDCDDSNPAVHPGSSETCNGSDDDCNGKVDEDACDAKAGLVCIGRIQKCVSPCTANSCKAGEFCDPETLQCVQSQPQDIGAKCLASVECKAPGTCYFTGTLTSAIIDGKDGKGMCSTPCCTSADCPRDLVCFAPGNGGKYCVPGATLKRATAGAKNAGEQAAAATECRSGAIANGRCSDTCCLDTDCKGGSHCQVGSVEGHVALTCVDWPGSKRQDGTCGSGGSQCASGVCENVSIFYTDRCLDFCCNQSQCGTLLAGTLNPTPCTCIYDFPNQNVNEPVPRCYVGSTGGSGAPGDTCAKNDDCVAGFCANLPNGFCASPCCKDADCANPKHPGMKCGLVNNRPRCVLP